MANQLKMALVQAILLLRKRGWSFRRIARELGVHRETVARHAALAGQKALSAQAPDGPDPVQALPKPAKAPIGSDADPQAPKPAKAPIGSECSSEASAKPPIPAPVPTRSACQPLHEVIRVKLVFDSAGMVFEPRRAKTPGFLRVGSRWTPKCSATFYPYFSMFGT
jgi:hypothetical protein